MSSAAYTFTVELIPTEPDGYSVHVPALPGVVTSGETIEDALAMAREAIALHIEGLREDGREIPVEPLPPRKTVRVLLNVAA
jgi:antitoxin HicB